MKCFLFGLLNKDRVQQLEETFKFTISKDIKEELLICLEALEKSDSYLSQLRLIDLLHCLYETQDKEFITQALSYFPKIALKVDEETQLLIYSFCLQHCYSLQTIKLTAMAELKTMLDLNPIAKTCFEDSIARISHYWKDLFSVLHKNEFLRKMDLYESRLNKSLMKILSEELSHPRCKLQKLLFGSVCFLNDCQDFSFLTTCHTLTHLDLKDVDLEDNGVRILCQALKSQRCKLRVLRLVGCILTSEGCLDLAPVLVNNQNLWSLDLGNNNIKDAGLHTLCDALKDPNCHTRRLGLENCGLTPICCKDLLSLFSTNQSLIQMNLMKNALGYNTIRNLCKVLRSPTCKMKFLALDNKEIYGKKIKKFMNDVKTNNPQLVIKPHYYKTEKYMAAEMLEFSSNKTTSLNKYSG
ncbi:hypothetical protein STEG23_029616 [Scotinomys teguina]